MNSAEGKNLFTASFCSWAGASVRQQMLICLSFPTKPHSVFTGLAFHSREDNTPATEKCTALHFCNRAPTERKPLLLHRASCGGKGTKKDDTTAKKRDKDQAQTQKTKPAEQLRDVNTAQPSQIISADTSVTNFINTENILNMINFIYHCVRHIQQPS